MSNEEEKVTELDVAAELAYKKLTAESQKQEADDEFDFDDSKYPFNDGDVKIDKSCGDDKDKLKKGVIDDGDNDIFIKEITSKENEISLDIHQEEITENVNHNVPDVKITIPDDGIDITKEDVASGSVDGNDIKNVDNDKKCDNSLVASLNFDHTNNDSQTFNDSITNKSREEQYRANPDEQVIDLNEKQSSNVTEYEKATEEWDTVVMIDADEQGMSGL